MNRPLEVCLHHLPAVAGSTNAWEAAFAKSLLKQARRRNWRPTPKQEAIMQRLVGELFNETDCEVLEEI